MKFKFEPVAFVGLFVVIANIILDYLGESVGLNTAIESVIIALGAYVSRSLVVPTEKLIEDIDLPHSS